MGHHTVSGGRVLHHSPLVVACIVVVLLGGCSSQPFRWDEPNYVVQRGDTLYKIAFRYGLDYRQLARWNNLQLNQTIYPGQRIRLQPGTSSTATVIRETASNTKTTKRKPPKPSKPKVAMQPAPRWVWPTRGDIVAKFGDANSVGKGLDIKGFAGAPILAAAPGKVMYAGSGLIGYGKLIIIKHNESYLSAYGHNQKLLAKQGDQVTAGQQIAEMGLGPSKRPVVHFEIRVNGKAVDPLKYLPPL
ncbi:MAG: peptidoglycan DD-metalloendopeptidase family protein [Pseudomonadota bacterium]